MLANSKITKQEYLHKLLHKQVILQLYTIFFKYYCAQVIF